jgi:hypothetical protein
MSDEDLGAVDAPVPHSGSEDLVNAANREEQIRNALQAISINIKDEQFAALREGFSSAIPDELFEGIEPREVGAFIFGDAVISIDDLERNHVWMYTQQRHHRLEISSLYFENYLKMICVNF